MIKILPTSQTTPVESLRLLNTNSASRQSIPHHRLNQYKEQHHQTAPACRPSTSSCSRESTVKNPPHKSKGSWGGRWWRPDDSGHHTGNAITRPQASRWRQDHSEAQAPREAQVRRDTRVHRAPPLGFRPTHRRIPPRKATYYFSKITDPACVG